MTTYSPFVFNYPVGQPTEVAFGGDTSFRLISIDGLDPTDVREDIADKSEADGSFIYARYLDYRRITFEGDIAAGDQATFEGLVNTFKAAFTPQINEQALDFELGDGVAKRVYCRPSKLHLPIDNMYSIAYGHFHVELIAESPLIVSAGGTGGGGGTGVGGTHTISLLLGTSTPLQGLDFGGAGNGLDFGGVGGGLDFGGGGGTQAQATATNAGNVAASPTARITGPVTNPKIRNITTGQTLGFIITLASGEYLDIDFAARTVMLGGTSSRYNTLDPANPTFWQLQPGDNTVQFVGTGSDPSTTCLVAWRDAWL